VIVNRIKGACASSEIVRQLLCPTIDMNMATGSMSQQFRERFFERFQFAIYGSLARYYSDLRTNFYHY
jgi:hypothetical protein